MKQFRRPRTTDDLTAIFAQASGQAGSPVEFDPSQLVPGHKGPGTESPLVRNVYPPWVYKLPMSRDFNQNNFAAALAAGAGAVIVPVQFQTTPTFVGYVQTFGIYVLSPTALTDVIFTLRIAQAPVEGFDNIRLPPGVANFFVRTFGDLQVRIPNGALVDAIVTNQSAAGPWTVGTQIAGWTHPETEERRIYGDL